MSFYKQNISNCFGLSVREQELFPLLSKSTEVVQSFKNGSNPKVAALLEVIKRTSDLAAIKAKAKEIRDNFKNVILLGTGGSSLSGQALTGIKEENSTKIFFASNIDPVSFRQILNSVNLKETLFLVISKSGETLETISQFLVCFGLLASELGNAKAAKHFLIITELRKSALSKLAERFGIETLAHEENIGGRFSTFTNVGLLPSAIAGLDIKALRAGATQNTEAAFHNPAASELAKGIAINLLLMKKYSGFVYMHYTDQLSGFINWQRQIWAESLGKNGHGTTPIRAAGTIDQHSQLQLYLSGPKDKFFTFLYLEKFSENNLKIDPELIDEPELQYLKGKSLNQIIDAERQATMETLIKNGAPVRSFAIGNLNEMAVGALFSHFMLETIGTGLALEINPFDQPAVEEGKVIARKLLGEK